MCGHVGVAGKIDFKSEKLFKQGLIVDSLRGDHSTGILSVPRNTNDPVIVKQVGNPFELFNDKRFDEALRGTHRVLLGHNRYATQGAVNKYNAHPFNFDHIYGAHNGTLRNWMSLDGYQQFKVDSQGLYHHIANNSVEDALGKIEGAWALVWWNHDTQELNFLRNDERSFYYAMNSDNSQLFWASEAEMLLLLLNRNSVSYKTIHELKPDNWMRFPIAVDGTIGKPRNKKVEGKKPIVYHNCGRGVVNLHGTSSQSTKAPESTKKEYVTTGNVIRKGVVMEVLGSKMDCRRAPYLSLLDADNQDKDIRVYIKQGDEFIYKKDFIVVGDISSFTSDENGYYKVFYSSLRKGTIEEQVHFDEAMGRFDQTTGRYAEQKYKDHQGKMITKEEWEKRYPSCAWCSADLKAEEENWLTKGGDAVCPDCSKDEDVRAFL